MTYQYVIREDGSGGWGIGLEASNGKIILFRSGYRRFEDAETVLINECLTPIDLDRLAEKVVERIAKRLA